MLNSSFILVGKAEMCFMILSIFQDKSSKLRNHDLLLADKRHQN